MLLVLVAVVNDNWVRMMPQGIGGVFSFCFGLAGADHGHPGGGAQPFQD